MEKNQNRNNNRRIDLIKGPYRLIYTTHITTINARNNAYVQCWHMGAHVGNKREVTEAGGEDRPSNW